MSAVEGLLVRQSDQGITVKVTVEGASLSPAEERVAKALRQAHAWAVKGQ